MPVEIFIIVLAGLGLGLFGMFFDYLKHRSKQNVKGGSSMTTSELRTLIEEAVEKATAPLHARIDELEERVDATPQLEEHRPLLDLDDLPESENVPPVRTRRKTR